MTWDPDQYNRFAADREQPFWDLAALIEPPASAPVVVDLGCGDGRLTAELHRRLGAARTLGIDSSPEMLARAEEHAGPDVIFERGDLSGSAGEADIVFANASLHWTGDHLDVLARWQRGLRPGGQLAVQVPSNAGHPSHQVARELASEWLGPEAPPDPVEANVLEPGAYAEALFDLGFGRQSVRLQVYGHLLASSAEVIEWVNGTSLTRFRRVLEPKRYEEFVAEYRSRLMACLGERQPYFYAFRRVLFWARLED